jgi:hypothetical protein
MCACVRVRACAFLSVPVLARASVCVLASVRACVLVSVLLACVRAPHSLGSFPSHCECDVGACGCAYRRQTAPVDCAHERTLMPPLMRCLPAGTAPTSATTCSSSPRTSRYVVRSLPGESAPRTVPPALHCTPFNCAALRRDNHAGSAELRVRAALPGRPMRVCPTQQLRRHQRRGGCVRVSGWWWGRCGWGIFACR